MVWSPGKEVTLLLFLMVLFEFGNGLHVQVMKTYDGHISNQISLRREKREWVVPPINMEENRDYSKSNPIAKIRSDHEIEAGKIITYKITGQGADEPPYGLFIVDRKTGDMNVTRIVDREEYAMFHLKGYAMNQYGSNEETPLDLRIRVIDVNDNPPIFTMENFIGSVEELSVPNTVVMKLLATDADEENTINTKLAYKIISQEPSTPQMFMVRKNTGEICTASGSLDRETQSTYNLVVEGRDLDGAPSGLFGRSTATVKVLDVNDNFPYLERDSYEGNVDENAANVEVLRMKAFDKDEEFSDNWLANFKIISGNEGGFFAIETDSQTNEGVLRLVKEVDYETMQNLNLAISVANKAEFHSSVVSKYQAVTVPVKIKVNNKVDGPAFMPGSMVFSTTEATAGSAGGSGAGGGAGGAGGGAGGAGGGAGGAGAGFGAGASFGAGTGAYINKILGKYPAIDGDTGKPSDKVKYAKGNDPDNWLSVDPVTAEIKLAKIPDRESPYVVGGNYTATILAISDDLPAKTATGTIVLSVQDINDNCPKIPVLDQQICDDATSINVTAEDRDGYPNGAPFKFQIIDEPVGVAEKWKVGATDATSMQLVPLKNIWPGTYEVPIQVQDKQGLICPDKQILKLQVCTCPCVPGARAISRAVLGPAAIGLMILGCLLLLLAPLLLLLCKFGSGAASKGFLPVSDGATEMLHSWNNEGGKPEDKEIPSTIIVPSVGAGLGTESGTRIETDRVGTGREQVDMWEMESRSTRRRASAGPGFGRTVRPELGVTGTAGMTGTVNEMYLGEYFIEKSKSFAEIDEARPANDCLMVYSHEGVGSPAGSVDCISFTDGDLDENVLDNLGPKFKTLAEVCTGQEIKTEWPGFSVQSTNRSQTLMSQSGTTVQNTSLPRQPVISQSSTTVQNTSLPKKPAINQTVTTVQSSKVPNQPVINLPGSTVQSSGVIMKTVTVSNPTVQIPKPTPETMVQNNVLITDSSHYAGSGVQLVRAVPDSLLQKHVVVTEQSLAPGTILQPIGVITESDMLQQNYVLMERSNGSSSNIQGLLQQNYVLAERSDGSSSNVHGILQPISNHAGAQNVIVTERKMVTTPARTGYLVSTDPVLHQQAFVTDQSTAPNPAVSKSVSKVTKQSTVQYSSR